MCWNAPVSGIFASLETIAILLMFLRTRVPVLRRLFEGQAVDGIPGRPGRKLVDVDGVQWRDNLMIPMLLTINIVEWCELGIWLSDPEEFADRDCRPVNKVLTHIAAGVVWLQPTFTMMYCRFTGPEPQRPWFTIPLVLAVMTTAGYYLSVILGETGTAVFKSDERDPTALAWSHTCAYVGPNGYLEWRYRLANLPILPTMFAYHLFFNFALMFHCFPVGFAAGAGSVFVVMVQFLAMDGSGEAWSMWCWSGCLFIMYYWVVNCVEPEFILHPTLRPTDPCSVCLPWCCPMVDIDDPEAEAEGAVEGVVASEGHAEGAPPSSTAEDPASATRGGATPDSAPPQLPALIAASEPVLE